MPSSPSLDLQLDRTLTISTSALLLWRLDLKPNTGIALGIFSWCDNANFAIATGSTSFIGCNR